VGVRADTDLSEFAEFAEFANALRGQRAQSERVVRHALEGTSLSCHDLFELAPLRYVVTTPDTRILYANQEACALLGKSKNALAGSRSFVMSRSRSAVVFDLQCFAVLRQAQSRSGRRRYCQAVQRPTSNAECG
jgi:PAS domain-containing protein